MAQFENVELCSIGTLTFLPQKKQKIQFAPILTHFPTGEEEKLCLVKSLISKSF